MAANMDALLKITAQVDGANNIVSLNRGLQSVEGTAKGVTTAMRGMTGAASGLSGALGALAPLLSVAGLVGLAKGALEAGDRMNDLSQSTGVSVESLAKFKKAAATSGTDIDGVAKALVKLSKGMLEASAGNKQASAAFKALGVSITDSKGSLKASDEVMIQVANRFKAMPDGVAKTALALKLFGKAGAEMIPMLNMGGDAIEKLGSKMTTAFARKADEYNDKLAMLSGKVGALGQDLFLTLLPALTAVTDAVSKAVQGLNDLPGPMKELATAGVLLAIAWGPIGGLVKGASVAFIAGTAAIEAFQVQLALAAMEGIPAFEAALLSVPIVGWAAALAALGVALYANNQEFRGWANAIKDTVANDFVNAMKVMADAAAGAVKYISDKWQGLSGVAKAVATGVESFFENNMAAMASNVGVSIERVKAGFRSLISLAKEGIADVIAASLGLGGVRAVLTSRLLGSSFTDRVGNQKKKNDLAAAYGTSDMNNEWIKKANASGAAGYNPDLSALESGSSKSKNGADKAARLAEKRREQLADADKLLATENGRLEISAAANELEKIQAEYEKTKVERRIKFLALQKGALSEQARQVYAEAQFSAIEADRFEYNAKIQKLMQDQTKELYAQVGLARTLDKELQRSMGSAFSGSTGTGTFRTDVDLMPGLTGGELGAKIEELKKSLADLQDPIKQVMAGAQAIGEAFSSSFKGLIDGSMSAQQALAGFFKSIANHFLDMASQMIAKYIEMQIIGLASKFLPGFGSTFGPGGAPDFSGLAISVPNQYSYGGGALILGSANGNVFAANGIVPYAMGGIVDRPTLFPFAKGIGLMGEAGPEAIMPLKRGADGKLGVAGGGGGTTVNVSVDAKGTSVSGDGGNSAALGRAIAASVQQELIRQKRPGGLLA